MALLNLALSLSDITILAVCSVILWYAISATAAWYRLRDIPGPFLASFSYLWLARIAQTAKTYDIHHELCKKYGSLVRVGPNELTTDDPEVIRRMSAARSTWTRDPWNTGARFNPYHDNIFTIMDNVAHDKMKAKIGGAFAGREAPLVELGVDEQVERLIQLIRENYLWNSKNKESKLLDLAPLMSYLTMDIITKVAFGDQFGYLEANADLYQFLQSVRENWPKLAMTVDVPWARAILLSPLFLKFFGPKVTDNTGFGKLMR